MQMSIRMTQAIPCPACGAHEDHKYRCPQKDVDTLAQLRMHVECPKCRANAIDRNDDDFMECRECHMQFVVRVAFVETEGLEQVMLDLPDSRGGLKLFRVLPQKGTGKFSLDRAFEAARNELRKAISRQQKS